MAEMTRRERILKASRHQMVDRVPFFHNWRHCQQGWAERDCRNRGMGLSWARPSYTFTWHGVEVTETYESYTTAVQTLRRTFRTPWAPSRRWRNVKPALGSGMACGVGAT
jgi:hypothetical protein